METTINLRNRRSTRIIFTQTAEFVMVRSALAAAVKAGVSLRGVDLHDAWLDRAELSGLDLRGADLDNAELNGTNLKGTNLNGARLRNAKLHGVNLANATLRCTDLSGADLRNADLRNAELWCADLRNANLSGADLRHANLKAANLHGADLRGADLEHVNLERANLNCADLREATFGEHTLPVVVDLDGKLLRYVEAHPGALVTELYYNTQNRYSRAGWAIILAGGPGFVLQKRRGLRVAAALIYAASYPTLPIPNFQLGCEDALADIRARAALATVS
jgi:uncharacterized protein YjbI with pentapeptide repeats